MSDIQRMQEEAARKRQEAIQRQQEIERQQKLEQAAAATTQPSIPTMTGAERVATGETRIIRPEITKKVTEVKVQRTQRQIQQLEETVPKVQETITKLDENISNLSSAPGRWQIEDPNTGEMRPVVGSDIERLMRQKQELESWLKTADETKPLLKEYEAALTSQRPTTTTTKTKYKVTYDDGRGEHTKIFDTQEEAAAFISVRRGKAERALEQTFQGLSLQEQAEVILQERRGQPAQSLVRGTVKVGPGETQKLEELIENGTISPQQIITWSQKGEIEVGVLIPSEAKGKAITLDQAVKRVEKIVSDDITLLFASGEKKLADIPTSTPVERRGKPLTSVEWDQALARAAALKDYTIAGIVLGVATTLSPKTWRNLPKDAMALVKTPIREIWANTAEAAVAVAASYSANPIGTSGLLLGSAIGSAIGFRVITPAVGAAFKYGVQKPVTVVQTRLMSTATYKRLATASANFYGKVSEVVPSYGQLKNQLTKEFGGPIDTFDPSTKTSLLRLPLWDTYRQFKKLDFEYVPADPKMATISHINNYTEFLKIKLKYLEGMTKQKFTETKFGEFVTLGGLSTQGLKYKQIPENYGILHQARLWANLNAISVKDPLLAEKYAGAVASLLKRGEHVSPFDFGAVADYPKSTAGQQMEVVQKVKDFWRQFDPTGDYPMPTPWEQEQAVKFWKDLMSADNEYGAVNVEANALYQTLLEKGVSNAKATETASDYATALTIVSVMRTASPEETQRYLQHLAIVMDRLGGSDVPLGYDAVADVMRRLNKGLEENQFKGFQAFIERAEQLSRDLEKTGELDDEKYASLLKDLMKELDLQVPATVEDTIDKVIPSIVPIVELDIAQIPDTRLDEITETITEETKETKEDTTGRRDRSMRVSELPSAKVAEEKGRFRVKFSYPGGSSQSLSVEASSYPEALNRAQRLRRSSREPPYMADLEKVK